VRIEALRSEDRSDGQRISARVVWEGAHRGPDGLWFETDAPFADDLEPAPETFLLAAMPLAAGLGEPRLAIEGRVDARLRDGLVRAMAMLAGWYPSCREVPIEASGGFAPLAPREPPRVAAFLSGGVDSLSAIRANRRAHGPDDPASARDAIHLFGWHSDDFDGQTPRPERLRQFRERHGRLAAFASSAGLALVPVRTNVRTFHPSFPWSRDVAFGAGMISAAHPLRARVSRVLFASGGYPGEHPPHGSHPSLDPLFSSAALEVVHAEPGRTRLEKVRAIAEWPAALSVLEVCLHHELPAPGVVNCGRCEKCVRTMLALEAVGRLDAAVTFPARERLAQTLSALRLAGAVPVGYASELLRGLEAAGRHDLARLLERKMRDAERRERRRGRWWRRLARGLRGRRRDHSPGAVPVRGSAGTGSAAVSDASVRRPRA
jgi:hypothetical protein